MVKLIFFSGLFAAVPYLTAVTFSTVFAGIWNLHDSNSNPDHGNRVHSVIRIHFNHSKTFIGIHHFFL